MKHRKLFTALLLGGLILCTIHTDSEARLSPKRPPQKKAAKGVKIKHGDKVEFSICYDFFVSEKTSKIKFICVIPATLQDRQEILDIQYSSKPSKVFSKNGKKYAEFVLFEPEKRFRLEIKTQDRKFRYDLRTARRMHKQNPSDDPDLADFLKNENMIEVNAEAIQRAAVNIDGANQIEIVKQVHDFVAGHLKYVYSKKSKGALYAMKHGRGDCDEFTSLFVALCRAKKIPARWVSGYTANWNNTPKHSWAEVFLKNYGWVPFDPSKNQRSERDFASLKPMYIYVSNLRNNPILNGYQDHYFRYRGAKPKIKRSFSVKSKNVD